MTNFKERLEKVEAFIFDVDGVLTDGGITPMPDNDFLRTYSARDGYAISYALYMNYKVFIISGGRGEIMRRRFNYLKVTELHMEVGNKIEVMRGILERYGLDPDSVIFMGDDLPDLECMEMIGLPVCPSDSAQEVIDTAVYVSEYGGGKGCVRDIIEQTLRARGDWGKSKAVFPPKA